MSTYATQAQLNAEATARKAGDATNAAAVVTESTARKAADAALAARVTTLEGQMANVILRVAALEAKFTPPAPPSRPWALPVTTATYTVPGTIDHTGATDVTTALNAYIATVPDGSIISFAINGAVYKISSRLVLVGRNNLILEGNGYTTIHNVATPTGTTVADMQKSTFYSQWTETQPTHITIRNFISTAASPAPGVFQTAEKTAFANFDKATYIEITGIVGSGYYGDFLTLNENAQYVWAYANTIANCGRQNLSVVCGSHVLFEHNTLGVCGYNTFDIEPEAGSVANLTDIVIRNNTCGTWTNAFLSVDGVTSGKVITDVTVDSNTISGASLLTVFGQAGSARMSTCAVTNNTSDHAAAGPVLIFHNIDGLTITGNTQPLSSGSLVSVTSCTGVVGP